MNFPSKEIEKELLWKLSKIENVDLNYVKNNRLYSYIITTHNTTHTVTDELTHCVASWSKLEQLEQSIPRKMKFLLLKDEPLFHRMQYVFLDFFCSQ
jgi:uncharacterized Rmd1/YagE family protein